MGRPQRTNGIPTGDTPRSAGRPPRSSRRALAGLALLLLAGCATHPALMTRAERLELSRQGAAEMAERRAARLGDAAPAPVPSAPLTPRWTGRSSGAGVAAAPRDTAELAALRRAEQQIADGYYALRGARDANVALAAALRTWQSSPSSAAEERCRTAFRTYQESHAMTRRALAIAALCLTGCNSVSSQIRALNEEERELADEIAVMNEHRKSIIALTAALQQVQRDGGNPKSEAAVAKARQAYERTKDAAD